jgi:hypothetical protein
METRAVAQQTQVPVQNTMTKMDILIVTQHCHRDTTAGKITLVENGERRLQNIVILLQNLLRNIEILHISISKTLGRQEMIDMDLSHFARVEKRVQNIKYTRTSQAAACACVGNTRDKRTELSQQRARMRT